MALQRADRWRPCSTTACHSGLPVHGASGPGCSPSKPGWVSTPKWSHLGSHPLSDAGAPPPGRITANVADSRAILVTGRGDSAKAVALSHDQTPYRMDERKRVEAAGARVFSKAERDGEIDAVNWSAIDIPEGYVRGDARKEA